MMIIGLSVLWTIDEDFNGRLLFAVDFLFQRFLGNDEVNWRKKIGLLGFTGRYIRFHPEKWINLPCLRVELLGTKGVFFYWDIQSSTLLNPAARNTNLLIWLCVSIIRSDNCKFVCSDH